MTQGVAYHDAMGRVLTANPAAQRILGLGPEHLHGYVEPERANVQTMIHHGAHTHEDEPS